MFPLSDLSNRRKVGTDAWLHDFPHVRLSIAALNSCEVESHRAQDHRGYLGDQQAQTLMSTWKHDAYVDWLKIIVVHHNPITTTPANIESWIESQKLLGSYDPELISRYASDLVGFEGNERLRAIVQDCEVQLVLHGHHHDQGRPIEWPWERDGRGVILSTGSWGLVQNQLPGDAPPSCQLLLFHRDRFGARLDAYPLVYEGRFRLSGQILSGNFVIDPAQQAGYSQSVKLPDDWFNVRSGASEKRLDEKTYAFIHR